MGKTFVLQNYLRGNMYLLGDDLIENALNEDESLCMDKVYDALDWYKKSYARPSQTTILLAHLEGRHNPFL